MKPPPVVVPPNEQWPADEVARLAGASGKPLEVACAVAFIAAKWEAWLGAHFDDDGRIRELDVLVEKNRVVPAAHPLGVHCTTRLLVSCKGFPVTLSPLAYSLSARSVPDLDAALIGHELLPSPRPGGTPEFVHEVETLGAGRLLDELGLRDERRVVGFDTIERNVARDSTVSFTRAKDGDRPLHGAIDSALKAALFWNGRKPNGWSGDTQPRVVLHIPICVLSIPMWDVPIDDGRVGDASLRTLAFQTNFYPVRSEERQITTIISAAKTLPLVIHALDALHDWLCNTVVERYPPGGPKS